MARLTPLGLRLESLAGTWRSGKGVFPGLDALTRVPLACDYRMM